MRITAKAKRFLSSVIASSLMLGIMVPAGYAEEQQPDTEQTSSELGAHFDEQVELNTLLSQPTVMTDVYATPTNPGSLLITEVVPDTKNVKGADGSSIDGYEFVEVYNNTDEPVNFKDYYFFYNDKDTWTPNGDAVIPAHGNIVFWIMNGNNLSVPAEDFIKNFNPSASLQEGVNLFRINGGGGMANASARNLQIKSKAGDALIVSASYGKEQVKENNGIFYKYSQSDSSMMSLMAISGTVAATPGTVDPEQLPELVPGDKQPVIEHHSQSSVDPADLPVTAKITNLEIGPDGTLPVVKLQYGSPSQVKDTVITMTSKGEGEYTAVIPAAALEEPELHYSIRVNNVTESYSVHVNLPAFDSSNVPPLLITELLPNSTNVKGTSSDAFEFIEVYNNTDAPIDFKNYKIYYRYPDKGNASDVKWPSTKESFVIPAQHSVVFWVINSANSTYTASDFNAEFNTNLMDGTNLFQIKSDGMANSGRRAVVIKSNTEKEISSAYYDADLTYDGGAKGDDTKENKALLYKYPVNGQSKMLKISTGSAVPSPGQVDVALLPNTPIHVDPDTENPTVNDLTAVTEIDQSMSLDLKAFADDNKAVTSVEVRVASDKQPDFVSHNLSQDFNDSLYHYKLSSADLIGRNEIQYYFVVSDGTNETESPVMKVKITGGPDQSSLRLNVKDGQFINGSMTVKGTSATAKADEVGLSIDNKVLGNNEVYAALENDAYFVFDAKNVDYYFKNGITMGPEELGDASILYTFMDPITTYTTLTFPISSAALQVGKDNVIYIRAGSKSSPFDPRPEENKDDFEVKNVRLLLADGTEVWDPAYAERDKEIKMGDSAGKHESIGFRFDLKSDLFRSKAYNWNTTEVTDGEHKVTVTEGGSKVSSNVVVDNTPPSIKASIEDGKTYRGNFVITAEIKDTYAGVDKVSVKLDGNVIELPYATSSGKLSGGDHTLSITALDKIGNQVEKVITFHVPNENPFAPLLISPQNWEIGVGTNPTLKVKVEDPNQDKMDVTFYRGFKYDGNHPEQGFTGFKNASDTEPPKQSVPAGEKALSSDEYSKISAVDGQYLINDAVEQFPYQRYEIKLDESVKASDRVDIEWKGNSLPGRKVSLYAWSPAEEKWILLDHLIAGTEDFELKSTVTVGEFASGHSIAVMVQDEIASATKTAPTVTQDTYDFSFVWMSDTQYYSQSYPYIYQKNVKWIADNKDNLNLKYVIHTGDVVDKSYQEYEWEEADRDMKVLEDAGIPYGVLAGNHDVGHQTGDYTKFWQYFGEWRFKDMPTFGGSYDNNRGHYDLVSANGNDFIIVYMGWGLAEEEIEWMNEIVARYPERKAILCLHEYLLVSNNRAPIADTIFEKVVKPNKNVIAALSGHYHDAELKVDELDDNGDGIADRSVYQMLADYQGAEEGGLGYIRLLQFDIANNKLRVKTYSPYLDDYNYYDENEFPGKDEFVLDLDLQPVTKRVATDYIGVKVYSDQTIATQQQVESGTETQVTWSKLNPESYYQWYTKVEDDNSGSVLSDIWGFYTGKEDVRPTPTPEVSPSPEVTPTPAPEVTSAPPVVLPVPTVTPTPTATPGGGKGNIELALGSNGTYTADPSALKKLIEEATTGGNIKISLGGGALTQDQFKLALDATSIQQAADKKLNLNIVSSSVTLSVPTSSLPAIPAGSDMLLLSVDTTTTAVQSNVAGMSPSKTTVTLNLSTTAGGKETAIHQFKGAVTITLTLTKEQLAKLDTDFAGVYYVNGSILEYLGGVFKGNTVTFTTDHFSSFAVLEYHKQFSDTAGHWAEPYISKLTAKHVIKGIDDTHYGPQANVTRADFVTLAIRSLGLNETSETTGNGAFADVSEDAYYASSIDKAVQLGLIQGSDGKFRPKDAITREEAAVVLQKLIQYKAGVQSSIAATASFKDMNSVSEWAKQAVSELKAKGILDGKGDNHFDPRGKVTRAEIAKLLYGIINL
ncbi:MULTISPECIES: S-layer homology domain-containing protein [unclassified Paenibacillus]|uniref:S-layer homology domain-containing protein n=1 Tax=unclassified Paenibacillus TaxID=185978 RepID=UPI0006942D13|nr:S-layer homology domain-containing protein [Paenibacillus sp. FSL H7-0737]